MDSQDELFFIQNQSAKYKNKNDIGSYYFTPSGNIYSDKLSEFGFECNIRSKSAVIRRIEQIYDHIYIDEVQDLAGYDLEILELLLKSSINVTLVGDHRQATYKTHQSKKNKKFSGSKVIEKFKYWEKSKLCSIHYMNHCYRSNQIICNLADQIFPNDSKSISQNNTITGHDGVFIVPSKHVDRYIEQFTPQVLRYNKKTLVVSPHPLNFGNAKGLTFSRVLIYPHTPLKQLIRTGDFSKIEKSASKIYVAVTRARYSVGIVYDGDIKIKKVSLWN